MWRLCYNKHHDLTPEVTLRMANELSLRETGVRFEEVVGVGQGVVGSEGRVIGSEGTEEEEEGERPPAYSGA